MSTEAHQKAIAEVQQWLGYRDLDEFIYTLLEAGYDDLDAISQCLPSEQKELEDIFSAPTTKANIRVLVEVLQQVGIENYRKSKKEFVRLLQEAVSKLPPPTAAATTAESTSSPIKEESNAAKGDKKKKGKLEGYFSIHTDRIGVDKWIDKFLQYDPESATLSWLTSRKEGTVDQSFDLKELKTMEQIESVLKLSFANCYLELWGSNLPKWRRALAGLGVAEQKSRTESFASDDSDRPKRKKKKESKDRTHKEDEEASSSESDHSDDSDDSDMDSLPFSITPADPEAKQKGETLDDAISFQAIEKAKLITSGILPTSVPAAKLPEREMGENEKKLVKMFQSMIEGAQFKKFKRGSSSKRTIFITALLDFLCWGDAEKNNIKGSIYTDEIQEINQGFGKNKNRIYVVTHDRTLELEAGTSTMAKEWKAGLEILMKIQKITNNKKTEFFNSPEWKDNHKKYLAEHTQLLVTGDVFKKWPGRKKLQKGKFTCRKIWAPQTLDRLNWGEISSSPKVKGFLLIDDIVEVWEDPTDKLKFSLIAKGRSLDLEAKSLVIRDKWVHALRFFVETHKEQIKKAPASHLPHRKSS